MGRRVRGVLFPGVGLGGRREGGREGGVDEVSERGWAWREDGKEGRREKMRDGGREGRREGGREGLDGHVTCRKIALDK